MRFFALFYHFSNANLSFQKIDTPEQQREVSLWTEAARHGVSGREYIASSNIIIILVESLMSVASDLLSTERKTDMMLPGIVASCQIYAYLLKGQMAVCG